MKKMFLMAALFVAASLVWAQDTQQGPGEMNSEHHDGMMRHGPPSPAEQVKRLTKELSLTSEQQTQVKQIFEQQKAKHEAAAGNEQNLSPDERRANFMAARKEVDSKIEAVLTDQQKQKFKQMQANRERHRRGNLGEGEQGPPPDQQQ